MTTNQKSSDDSLQPENVSHLINQVLKTKDPAAVGLRKILRKHEDSRNDFPVKSAELQEFGSPSTGMVKLSDDDRHILELEKKVADLQVALKQQNEKTIAAVQASYVKGKTEGRESGRSDGLKTAQDAYNKKIDELQNKIAGMLSTLEISKKMMFHHSEHLLLELCMAMVEKIVKREVSEQRELILRTLKQSLTYIGDHDKMVIRVAPGDYEVVSGRRDYWLPVSERLKDITIEQDDRIEPGGCILDCNTGLIDARLGVQLDEVRELLEKTWNDIQVAIVSDT